jgi:hypothetical protein
VPKNLDALIPWAPDTNNTDVRVPVNAPLRGDPKARSRLTYDRVIDQFAVEKNPRYTPRLNDTYCSTFVWDVTRAMDAVIPYWVGENGEPLEPQRTAQGWTISDPSRWMSANDMNLWLNRYGSRHGWREVSPEEAQDLANWGHPAVASVYDAYNPGHIGIVRPGKMLNGPSLAQAGPYNFNHVYVYDCFPRENLQFFVNDTGVSVEADTLPRPETEHFAGPYTARRPRAAFEHITRRLCTLWRSSVK